VRPELAGPEQSRRRAILAAVMLGSILGPIDASVVNVVLPTIARSFSASLAAAQWVPMLYLVTAGSLILFFGRLGDLWGYRRVLPDLRGGPGRIDVPGALAVLGCLAAVLNFMAQYVVVFGLGTGTFQSPNNSAVMGAAPREHLGVVSSLLGTSRSVGMVLGVAAAGAVLYAAVPASVLKAPELGPAEAAAFSAGLRWAYAAAALFAAASALLSIGRGRRGVG
jgi:MFS family permease